MVLIGPNGATEWHETGTSLDATRIAGSLRGIGTSECHEYRLEKFKRHYPLASALRADYLYWTKIESYVAANRRLSHLDKRLQTGDLNLTADSQHLKNFSENLARQCGRYSACLPENKAIQKGIKLCQKYSIDPPLLSEGPGPPLARLNDEHWWLRQIRRLQKRTIEGVRRDLGQVRQTRSCYVSTARQKSRIREKAEQKKYLSETTLINGEGKEVTLLEVYEHTVANPAVRRAELMTRIRGFEVLADSLGDVAEFYTISAPGCMHAYRKTGMRNPRFDGSTPQDIQKYLNHIWQLIRSALHKKNIAPYGFRVVEPHHDGTPHWHLLLFMPPAQIKAARKIMRKYALQLHPEEKGATKHRFKAVSIDPKKGSAAGYIAKYVAKNIDGAHMDTDLYGEDAKLAAQKIEAWASTWGIRQFQQIGGPSVTVWRELRRLREPTDSELEPARLSADAGDWAAYCLFMRGDGAGAARHRITLAKETHPDPLDRYGSARPPRTIGIEINGSVSRTRTSTWIKQPGPGSNASSICGSPPPPNQPCFSAGASDYG